MTDLEHVPEGEQGTWQSWGAEPTMLRSREANGMRDLGSWGWSPGIRTQGHLGRKLAWASNELVSFTRVTVLWARNSSSSEGDRGGSISERIRVQLKTTAEQIFSKKRTQKRTQDTSSCCHAMEGRFSRAQGKWWLEADKWELGVRGREDGKKYVRIQDHKEPLMSWRENDSEPAMDM